MFNIGTNDGRLMLGQDLPTFKLAEAWLKYYQRVYRAGRPYPNGKGAYPDFDFHIVEVRSIH